MSYSITITRSEQGPTGRYEARVAGRAGRGELTYARTLENQVIADHTRVDESLRGTGVAKALVERLVADAHSETFTIVPVCSYIRAQHERHPEWSDLFDASPAASSASGHGRAAV